MPQSYLTEFTRMPLGANSCAALIVIMFIAAFEAQYRGLPWQDKKPNKTIIYTPSDFEIILVTVGDNIAFGQFILSEKCQIRYVSLSCRGPKRATRER